MLMSAAYQIVICAGIVPDPLQAFEPACFRLRIADLKNEMLLPAIFDLWASHLPCREVNRS